MIDQKIANLVRTACAAGTPAEASNAAVMACRMLMSTGAVPKDSQQPASGAQQRSSSPFGAGLRSPLSEAEDKRRIAALEREKRDLVAANQRLQCQIEELKNPPKCITAKFNSHCRKCEEIIHEGEKCWWQPGVKGACCIACGHS